MLDRKYADYAWEQAAALLRIDSPTGFTAAAADWTKAAFESMGYPATQTNKGGILVDLGGENDSDGLLLAGHIDTLGCLVAQIKADGRIKVNGPFVPNNCEGENIRLYTRSGTILEGTYQLCNASLHVNGEYNNIKRNFDTMEVVLDEPVTTEAEVRALGVEVGDYVCFEPRTRRTSSGYLKSRFLDDKLSVGVLMAFAKFLKDQRITLARRTWIHITVYEEVGHGCSGSAPAGITEGISLDMGCVGDGLYCTERQVSICAKDSGGPYSYEVVGKLIEAAKKTGADYAVDVYPHYGSDVEATLKSGADIRHGLIGPGVYASHGYERSHIDGVYNTLKVLQGYLNAGL